MSELKQTVPQDSAIRESIRLAAEALVRSNGLKPPLGLMHLKKTDNGFEVSGFDAVEDGAGNRESAKRIFGDNFDAFEELNGNAEKREDIRLRTTADYVKKHQIPVTMLQDFGWPAVELPK